MLLYVATARSTSVNAYHLLVSKGKYKFLCAPYAPRLNHTVVYEGYRFLCRQWLNHLRVRWYFMGSYAW